MKVLFFFFAIIASVSQAQEIVRVQNGATLTIQSSADLTVQGGFTLDEGSTLSNNGTIIVKRNGVSGTADWIDNTTSGYYHGDGIVLLNSTGSQDINSSNTFGIISIDNAGLNLTSSIKSNFWYLKAGIVSTGANTVYVLSTTSAAIDADPTNANFNNAWINGKLRRFVDPATVNAYTFPVGNATRVNRAVMTDLLSSPLTGINFIDALFALKPGTDAGLVASEQGTNYVSVNDGGVWHLTPDAIPGAGNYDLQLYFNGFTGLSDNRFAILRRDDASSNAADWQVPPGSSLNNSGGAGRLVSDGYAQRNNISGFSQFGIAQTSFPLPVTLLDFNARRIDKQLVKVTWTTETEQNNRGFDVERRKANESIFSIVGFTPTKAINGNSNSRLYYIFNDLNSYGGISYYRLKQTDLDSRSHYTIIKAVNGIGETSVSVLIWPNPGKGQFSIRLDGAEEVKEGMIISADGRIVQKFTISSGRDLNISHLAAGSYTILIKDAFGREKHFSETVLVVRN